VLACVKIRAKMVDFLVFFLINKPCSQSEFSLPFFEIFLAETKDHQTFEEICNINKKDQDD
jgi:hypothetical protein